MASLTRDNQDIIGKLEYPYTLLGSHGQILSFHDAGKTILLVVWLWLYKYYYMKIYYYDKNTNVCILKVLDIQRISIFLISECRLGVRERTSITLSVLEPSQTPTPLITLW